jgi:hypothetical protein
MACLKRRGKAYYAQYYVGTCQKRVNLDTTDRQLDGLKLDRTFTVR